MQPPKCATVSVPEAGKQYYGIGKNASYEAARRGEILVIPVGRLLRVPVVAMDRKMERAGERDDVDARVAAKASERDDVDADGNDAEGDDAEDEDEAA